MAPPRIVRSDSQEREFQRQRLERSRQYRKDPQVRARDAERKRLKRQADRELRNREARAKRARRRDKRPADDELRARRKADPSYEPTKRTIRVRRRGSSRANSSELCVSQAISARGGSASAAECASSKTRPSLSAGKCDSQTQCVVPLMFKSSQAALKTALISVQVQTPAAVKIVAGTCKESVSASECGSSKTRPSQSSAGRWDAQTQCVVPFMFKSSQVDVRPLLRTVRVQTERTGERPSDAQPMRHPQSLPSSAGKKGDQRSGGFHFAWP
ncbi:uncharacterized protein LOC144145904 isoform X2 [Haemaphysalis longicornis]